MARAFWKGSISFGLVEIPVRLQPAVQAHDLSFALLDRKDFSPVGFKRYNKNSGREVPWEQVVHGYEYEPDEYVVLSDEEIQAANVERSQSIDIVQFVQKDEIDPVYYETPYFIEPLQRGSKSYTLLRAALEKSGRVGIARVVLRTRQRLAALLVRGQVLMLDLLRYPHELRSMEKLDVPPKSAKGARVTETEIRMAQQLIDGMTGKFDPAKFKDEYRDDVMTLVRRKIKSGQTHTILEPETTRATRPARSEVMDLMPLLKQSLAERTGGTRRTARKRERPHSGTRRKRSA